MRKYKSDDVYYIKYKDIFATYTLRRLKFVQRLFKIIQEN